MANEKRLIDANAVDYENIMCSLSQLHWLNAIIEMQPTVDAVEVVHGYMVERIVDHECPWYTVFDCSECGCSVEKWHNYCPNCGAKMDGDVNG